jgi:endonuclease/exonuclease/phosphatase family metal-dependent hydrolase
MAVADTPLGEVALYTAHLSLRPWRNRRQPAALQAWVAATAGGRPAIIGGDFNAPPGAPHITVLGAVWIDAFRAVHPNAEGATHAFTLFGRAVRRQRLDYLFVQPQNEVIRIANCEPIGILPNSLSDHLPVAARLTARILVSSEILGF